MKNLSIVMVNHDTKTMCERAIESILKARPRLSYEIVVVDNSSQEEERLSDGYGGALVLSGVENKGFGHACNIGAKQAQGDALLFVNSDTELNADTLDNAYACFHSWPDIGALGIRTQLADGSVDPSSKRGFPTPLRALCYFLKLDKLFPRNKLFGGYHMTYLPDDQSCDVDAVSGSFLMVPKDLFFSLGGFDETFFMYGEDMDLCFRIKQGGRRVYYCADATMLHLKGQSGLHTKNPQVIYHFYQAMELFYDKHYKQNYDLFTTWIIHTAIRVKYYLAKHKRNH